MLEILNTCTLHLNSYVQTLKKGIQASTIIASIYLEVLFLDLLLAKKAFASTPRQLLPVC